MRPEPSSDWFWPGRPNQHAEHAVAGVWLRKADAHANGNAGVAQKERKKKKESHANAQSTAGGHARVRVRVRGSRVALVET